MEEALVLGGERAWAIVIPCNGAACGGGGSRVQMSLQWDEAKATFGGAADEEAGGHAGQRGARIDASIGWRQEAQQKAAAVCAMAGPSVTRPPPGERMEGM